MSVIPGFLAGIPFGLMVISLSQRYPKKNLIEISELVLGKWLGKGLGILVILVCGYFGGLLFGQVTDMFSRSILPEIPNWVFLGSVIFLSYLMVCVGIEVFARFSEVIFPIIFLGLIATIALAIPRFERGELLPLLENGIKPILSGTMQVIPWPFEFVLFLGGLIAFLPQGKQEMKLIRSQIWRIFIGIGFLNMLVTLAEIWVFGPIETARMTYGILTLGKMIEVSRTISGIESIFAMIWFGALIIKISSFQFIVFWGIQSLFKIKPWAVQIMAALIFLIVPVIFKRGSDLFVEIGLADRFLILPFTVGWVTLIWGVSSWKQREKASPKGH
jgi:spore germination protein (amino acid permease)